MMNSTFAVSPSVTVTVWAGGSASPSALAVTLTDPVGTCVTVAVPADPVVAVRDPAVIVTPFIGASNWSTTVAAISPVSGGGGFPPSSSPPPLPPPQAVSASAAASAITRKLRLARLKLHIDQIGRAHV